MNKKPKCDFCIKNKIVPFNEPNIPGEENTCHPDLSGFTDPLNDFVLTIDRLPNGDIISNDESNDSNNNDSKNNNSNNNYTNNNYDKGDVDNIDNSDYISTQSPNTNNDTQLQNNLNNNNIGLHNMSNISNKTNQKNNKINTSGGEVKIGCKPKKKKPKPKPNAKCYKDLNNIIKTPPRKCSKTKLPPEKQDYMCFIPKCYTQKPITTEDCICDQNYKKLEKLMKKRKCRNKKKIKKFLDNKSYNQLAKCSSVNRILRENRNLDYKTLPKHEDITKQMPDLAKDLKHIEYFENYEQSPKIKISNNIIVFAIIVILFLTCIAFAKNLNN